MTRSGRFQRLLSYLNSNTTLSGSTEAQGLGKKPLKEKTKEASRIELRTGERRRRKKGLLDLGEEDCRIQASGQHQLWFWPTVSILHSFREEPKAWGGELTNETSYPIFRKSEPSHLTEVFSTASLTNFFNKHSHSFKVYPSKGKTLVKI
ncbi:hypothetical protein AAY473_017380 [Plecturocebus cupreus]